MPLIAQINDDDAAIQQTRIYPQEELNKILAPIALYPDTLLSQILMASTYPLEVVEADRWLIQNQNLTGDLLDTALQKKPWDVSVKSLCHFPRVLAMMSEKLDLTNDLGNAFLDQQDQVMNTIQNLRAKAQEMGNLSSTANMRVTSQEGAITIEPVAPDVVYVPAYDPCWVYGWYSACTPPWFWYPEIIAGTGFFFGPAIFIGPLGFWSGFSWHQHHIFVNVDRTFVFHRPSITRMHGGIESWTHNPFHRRGISYQNQQTSQKFGQIERPGIAARRSFRGFTPEGGKPAMDTSPAARPDKGRLITQPQSIGTGSKQYEQPMKPQQGQTVKQPQRGTTVFGSRQSAQPSNPPSGQIGKQSQRTTAAFTTSPQSVQKSRGNAFESFGSNGREVTQHSERGQSSIGGSGKSSSGSHGKNKKQ